MDTIGYLRSRSAITGATDVPDSLVVMRGDPILSRLLYLRERWALGADIPALARLEEHTPDGTEPASIQNEWLREWWHAWACLDAVTYAWCVRQQIVDPPPVLHPEWFTVDDGADPGYASTDYRDWLASQPEPATAAGHNSDPGTARAAADAGRRGLVAIFVVPLAEPWTGYTRHLLGVSPPVFESATLLRSALGNFT